jgi:glutathione S-transferase
VARKSVRLYWQSVSHPSQAARRMLDFKQVEYDLVDVLPLTQRIHLRVVGFPGGTVPALKLDGHKVQGSRRISRELDRQWPDPPLFPADQQLRARVEEAERWGEQMLQPVPRRLVRFGSAHQLAVRRAGADAAGMPFAHLVALTSGPLAAYYCRTTIEPDGRRADEAGVREDLAALPELLGHVERLIDDGVLAVNPPNAATFQILASVRLLDAIADLRPHISSLSCVNRARELFPEYPAEWPSFLPEEWLEPLRALR